MAKKDIADSPTLPFFLAGKCPNKTNRLLCEIGGVFDFIYLKL